MKTLDFIRFVVVFELNIHFQSYTHRIMMISDLKWVSGTNGV